MIIVFQTSQLFHVYIIRNRRKATTKLITSMIKKFFFPPDFLMRFWVFCVTIPKLVVALSNSSSTSSSILYESSPPQKWLLVSGKKKETREQKSITLTTYLFWWFNSSDIPKLKVPNLFALWLSISRPSSCFFICICCWRIWRCMKSSSSSSDSNDTCSYFWGVFFLGHMIVWLSNVCEDGNEQNISKCSPDDEKYLKV